MTAKTATASKTSKSTAKPAAKVEKTATEGPRVIKAGGAKGQAVVEALTADVSLTRAQLAEKVGCTVGRVGEVVRYLAANGSKEEQALIAKHIAAQPARKAPAKKETPTKAAAKPAAKKAASKGSTTKPAAKPRGAARKTAAAAKDQAPVAESSTPQA